MTSNRELKKLLDDFHKTKSNDDKVEYLKEYIKKIKTHISRVSPKNFANDFKELKEGQWIVAALPSSTNMDFEDKNNNINSKKFIGLYFKKCVPGNKDSCEKYYKPPKDFKLKHYLKDPERNFGYWLIDEEEEDEEEEEDYSKQFVQSATQSSGKAQTVSGTKSASEVRNHSVMTITNYIVDETDSLDTLFSLIQPKFTELPEEQAIRVSKELMDILRTVNEAEEEEESEEEERPVVKKKSPVKNPEEVLKLNKELSELTGKLGKVMKLVNNTSESSEKRDKAKGFIQPIEKKIKEIEKKLASLTSSFGHYSLQPNRARQRSKKFNALDRKYRRKLSKNKKLLEVNRRNSKGKRKIFNRQKSKKKNRRTSNKKHFGSGSIYGLQSGPSYSSYTPFNNPLAGITPQFPNLNNVKRDYSFGNTDLDEEKFKKMTESKSPDSSDSDSSSEDDSCSDSSDSE